MLWTGQLPSACEARQGFLLGTGDTVKGGMRTSIAPPERCNQSGCRTSNSWHSPFQHTQAQAKGHGVDFSSCGGKLLPTLMKIWGCLTQKGKHKLHCGVWAHAGASFRRGKVRTLINLSGGKNALQKRCLRLGHKS